MVRTSYYFAHPTSMYNTPVEKAIEERFRERFPDVEVENPNQPHHSEGYQREGMAYFVDLCDRQDGVFFAPHSNGSLGAGVVKEVQSFLDREAPVYRFNPVSGEFETVEDLSTFSTLSVDDTRALLKEERATKPFESMETYRGLDLVA